MVAAEQRIGLGPGRVQGGVSPWDHAALARYTSVRSRGTQSEPLAVIPIHDVKQRAFLVPAVRCCARVGLYLFAPDPKRGGRSADRRTYVVVAFARRDMIRASEARRVP